MDATLQDRLHNCPLNRPALTALAQWLPAADADLDQLIAEQLQQADERAVSALLMAAFGARRPVDARHLPAAFPLLLLPDLVVAAALHARGDAVTACLSAARERATGWERQGLLLLVAAWLCKHRLPERPLPGELLAEARQLAREARTSELTLVSLHALERTVGSRELRSVLESVGPPLPPPVENAPLKGLVEPLAADPLATLPETNVVVLHEGGTLRRAVAKVGRNDPCPCGSGQKYKRCCFAQDQERLRHSTAIPGVTSEELEAEPEPFLTAATLEDLRGHKLVRLRLERVPPSLQGRALERLALFQQWEALVSGWEMIGWRDDLSVGWEMCLHECGHHQRADIAARLVAVRGLAPTDEAVPLGTRLLLARTRPADFLQLADAAVRPCLSDPRNLACVDVAYTFLNSDLPALGILVARGAATTAGSLDAIGLFDAIQSARDRLSLAPEDPSDWLFRKTPGGAGDTAGVNQADFEKARLQLEAADTESRRLRNELAEVRAQLERREKLAVRVPPQVPAAPAPAPPPDADLTALRQRIEQLKGALKERHEERNALRRELTAALTAAEAARAAAPAPPDAGEAPPDAEETALLAEETTSLHPPRLPAFPDRFERHLAGLPDNVVRAALAAIGRLGAGEPAAFVGMRRLRASHELCRVRIGADHRLLFRLHPHRLEIVELINRRDFERRLKTLV